MFSSMPGRLPVAKARYTDTAMAILASVVMTGPVFARGGTSASTGEFAAITARGRLLAEYQTAVSDAARSAGGFHCSKQAQVLWIARKTESGWTVVCGHNSSTPGTFQIEYEASRSSNERNFVGRSYDPPIDDTGYYYFAGNAIRTALHEFRQAGRFYTAVVLPSAAEQFYVYVLPAQTSPGAFIFGADARYAVSADGSTVLEKHRMHRSIIEFRASDDTRKVAAGVHSHMLSDIPEDSDVAAVLTRRPSVPEFIKTRGHLFVVDVDGTIQTKQ